MSVEDINNTMSHSTLAFVFPGQGSQSLGMMSDLADAFPVVSETFAEASAVLGYDLWQLIQQGPEQELNETDKTQPAMLAAGVAAWRVWQSQTDVLPVMMAGHSLGEYTALVCSGAINFSDAVALVADRGRFMQQAVPAGTGAMAAILGLEDDRVKAVCTDAAQGEVVAAVNFNSPGQVVIAGHTAAVTRAIDGAKAAGAKRALLLPVSVPSHCSLMQPAADNMQQRLASIEITTPKISIINNVDVTTVTSADDIRATLVRQCYQPVRWVETIQFMQAHGISTIVECGPGKVLAGLNKRIERSMTALPLFDSTSLQQALAAINSVEEIS
jgi:[acyl-carrier-protein] S-malonyltransferase